MISQAKDIQAEYYKKSADNYDEAHLNTADPEQVFALHFLSSIISLYSIRSILDVGAGTGRTIEFILEHHPNVKIIGIEPVKELREQGYKKGISPSVLIDGNGNDLNFKEGEFDLVCEFAVLHHVPEPAKVVSEMLRVAKNYIFISDSNNFGQGGLLSRSLKQTINFFNLWKVYNKLVTKGKGYHISEGDGLFYSYSVFNNYNQIKKNCNKIHVLNTREGNTNLYRSAPHIALLGVKDVKKGKVDH